MKYVLITIMALFLSQCGREESKSFVSNCRGPLGVCVPPSTTEPEEPSEPDEDDIEIVIVVNSPSPSPLISPGPSPSPSPKPCKKKGKSKKCHS